LFDQGLKTFKLNCSKARRTGDNNEIKPGRNRVIGQPYRLAYAAPRAIPLDRIADALADDKTATRGAPPVWCSIQRQHRNVPRLTLATYTLKLLGLAEPICTLHETNKDALVLRYATMAKTRNRCLARISGQLPVGTAHDTPHVADRQAVAAGQSAALQHCTPVLSGHASKKAVLAAAWNSLWLPCSFWHGVYLVLLWSNPQAFILQKGAASFTQR
jgi:hypothetical protein